MSTGIYEGPLCVSGEVLITYQKTKIVHITSFFVIFLHTVKTYEGHSKSYLPDPSILNQ